MPPVHRSSPRPFRAAALACVLLAGAGGLGGADPAAGAVDPATGASGAGPVGTGDEAAPTSRFIVSTEGGTPLPAALDAAGVHVAATRAIAPGVAEVTLDRPVAGRAAEAVADRLESTPLISAAVPNRRVERSGTPAPVGDRDPYFGDQWDLWDARSTSRAGGYGVDAARAWTITRGSASVVVAVLDTGITPHPDLGGARIGAGYDFVTNDDSVDDPIDSGDDDDWDPDPRDEGDACAGDSSSWHGTFVTGEIAADQDRVGVAGGAPGVTVLPVRILGACGGGESDEIAGMRWAAGLHVDGVPDNPTPANIVSMSLGAEGACDPLLQGTVDALRARGVTVIAAAGNDDVPVARSSPANCAGVVSVAATTRSGDRADYSNFGTGAQRVTVAAPGGGDGGSIWGLTWSGRGAFTAAGDRPGYDEYDGTSMATPRVSAAAALLLSRAGGLTPAQLTARLRATATPFPEGSTCTVARCGAGIVNAGDLVGAVKRFVSAGRPRAVGSARVGGVLAATTGSWHPGGFAARYRWYRDGVPIGGASHRRYTLSRADAGRALTVRVEVARRGYATATGVSGARHPRR